MQDGNRIMVAAWNTVLYEKFSRFRHLVVQGLSQHSDVAFDRRPYPVGARVLDVGCGFGDSTMRIAKRVGPSGEAVGVDCAENFVRAAEVAARDEQIENVRFSKMVVPGDQLELNVTLKRRIRNMALYEGSACVDGKEVASAEILVAETDK